MIANMVINARIVRSLPESRDFSAFHIDHATTASKERLRTSVSKGERTIACASSIVSLSQ